MSNIGFAILSYTEPEQLLRLTTTLNAMFADPPIVCHHNFGQCRLNEALFSPSVQFVHPHIFTRWGHISTPLAALRALSILRNDERPDWFVLLSGSDYPVLRADEMISDLSRAHYDAFLNYSEIPYHRVDCERAGRNATGDPASWNLIAYSRYCAPIPNQNRSQMREWWSRFSRPTRIFGGTFWFQANRKAIDSLVDNPSLEKLVRYFRARRIPEEALFHTALCNCPELRICRDHKRYEDWTSGGSHPKWLETADLPKIVSSRAHFARKFRPDGNVQRLIDHALLGL